MLYSKRMKYLRSIPFKYGLIMTAVTAVCLALMELTGQNESFEMDSPFQLIYMFVAPAVVWWLGIRARKQQQDGQLPFKQGFAEGFKISLVYGLVSPFLFVLYYILINPGILEYVRSSYGLAGQSDVVVMLVDMIAQLLAALFFGSIYAAIIAFLLRSRSQRD